VIESLLGDKGDSERGLTDRLRRRTAYVVAENESGVSKARKLVADLYVLRSDIVHGNANLVDNKIYLGHLREARELARKASVWFLESLGMIEESARRSGLGRLPTRKEIISVIDVLLDEDINPDQFKCTLDTLFTIRAPQAE
jgi:hypothetical protein